MMQSFHDHIRFLEKMATKLRIQSLEITHKAAFGSVGSMLSAMDVLVALYYGYLHDRPVMNIDPEKPGWEGQDYFVMSKSQACPALYSILADKGFFNPEECGYFGQVGSFLQTYLSKKTPGISVGVRSPGHGLSGAVGLSLALKMDKELNRVFCLIGDGELQEGQIWESVMTSAHYKLDNLIVIIDANDLQIDGTIRSTMNVDPIADKFESFGWKTIPVRNGHNFEELLYAFERAFDTQRKPAAIIAKTIKGKGVDFAENKASYVCPLSEQEMNEALTKLSSQYQLLESML